MYITPKYFRSLRSQYEYFQKRFYDAIIFFQVGRFYEFYGKQALLAEKCLGLSMIKKKYGYKHRCDIGCRALDSYFALALQNGHPVVVINQTGYMLPHVAERVITVKYLPMTHGQRK